MPKHEFSSAAYADLSKDYSSRPASTIFSDKMRVDMNPKGVTFREARDSETHPESIPVIVALDVTGSMGRIPEVLIKEKLGALMETLINNGVKHANICFIAIGDHEEDTAPLQIGQFESGTMELNHWLSGINIEKGGGGNEGESYHLAWLFAARHTSTDSFELRGRKGFLFTIGDEWCLPNIPASFLRDYMGYDQASDVSREQILDEARRTYHVFHIHINHSWRKLDERWKDLLGQQVIEISDPDIVAETISTTVAVVSGADLDTVTRGFGSAIGGKVSTALATIDKTIATTAGSTIATTGVEEL